MRNAVLILGLLLVTITSQAQSYINYAQGKSIKTTTEKKNTQLLVDGNLTTGSLRINPKGERYTIEMDLTAEFKIGGIHVYIDNKGILPIKDFVIEYKLDQDWVKIDEASVRDNFRDRRALKFNEPISMSAIRMVTSSESTFGLTEWQVWGKDVPEMPYQVKDKKPEPFIAKEHWICVNQVGYNLDAPKGFTVPTAKTDLAFSIVEKPSGKVVYTGKLNKGKGDFSDFNPADSKAKEYTIQVEGDGFGKAESYPFAIGKHILQEMAYQPTVDFFNDSRSIMGSHPSAYGGTAWRDGTYYTHEVPSMVILYLSNPEYFDQMPVTMDWEKEKGKVLSPSFKHIPEYKDDDPMHEAKGYYTNLPALASKNTPDLIQSLRFGVGWNLIEPRSADPSGDPLGKQLHSQTIEQFAYFLYGYPAYKKYIGQEFYQQVLDSTLQWWEPAGLFEVITKIGTPKGRHAPGHSIMPNLLMYEVAKREKLDNPEAYLKAAQAQTQWMIEHADWNNPEYTKGQRMSEHKTIQGLAHFQYYYPESAPEGLQQKLTDWGKKTVSLSDNMWDFRKFDDDNYTLPGYNEVGNVIVFPACAVSVSMTLEDEVLKERLVELAYSHYDNFMGRNPQNASSINHPELGFEGVEAAWPFPDKRKDICARLEITRGSLSSLPGSEMYPFNPKGRARHGEGWTVYNACWNLTIAYLNFHEGVGDPSILKEIK